jgi:hypothetical protein
MTGGFEDAVAVLRGWAGEQVVVRLDPDETVMRGRLLEFEQPGLDGVAFALADDETGMAATGVAIALFPDAAQMLDASAETLVVEQGRVRITVQREDGGAQVAATVARPG